MRIDRCTRCRRLAWPPRLWCFHCGGDAWEPAEVEGGGVETATTTRAGVRLATVVLDGGPPVLLPLDGEPETRVEL